MNSSSEEYFDARTEFESDPDELFSFESQKDEKCTDDGSFRSILIDESSNHSSDQDESSSEIQVLISTDSQSLKNAHKNDLEWGNTSSKDRIHTGKRQSWASDWAVKKKCRTESPDPKFSQKVLSRQINQIVIDLDSDDSETQPLTEGHSIPVVKLASLSTRDTIPALRSYYSTSSLGQDAFQALFQTTEQTSRDHIHPKMFGNFFEQENPNMDTREYQSDIIDLTKDDPITAHQNLASETKSNEDSELLFTPSISVGPPTSPPFSGHVGLNKHNSSNLCITKTINDHGEIDVVSEAFHNIPKAEAKTKVPRVSDFVSLEVEEDCMQPDNSHQSRNFFCDQEKDATTTAFLSYDQRITPSLVGRIDEQKSFDDFNVATTDMSTKFHDVYSHKEGSQTCCIQPILDADGRNQEGNEHDPLPRSIRETTFSLQGHHNNQDGFQCDSNMKTVNSKDTKDPNCTSQNQAQRKRHLIVQHLQSNVQLLVEEKSRSDHTSIVIHKRMKCLEYLKQKIQEQNTLIYRTILSKRFREILNTHRDSLVQKQASIGIILENHVKQILNTENKVFKTGIASCGDNLSSMAGELDAIHSQSQSKSQDGLNVMGNSPNSGSKDRSKVFMTSNMVLKQPIKPSRSHNVVTSKVESKKDSIKRRILDQKRNPRDVSRNKESSSKSNKTSKPDFNKTICPYELHGTCHDDGCNHLHMRDFKPTGGHKQSQKPKVPLKDSKKVFDLQGADVVTGVGHIFQQLFENSTKLSSPQANDTETPNVETGDRVADQRYWTKDFPSFPTTFRVEDFLQQIFQDQDIIDRLIINRDHPSLKFILEMILANSEKQGLPILCDIYLKILDITCKERNLFQKEALDILKKRPDSVRMWSMFIGQDVAISDRRSIFKTAIKFFRDGHVSKGPTVSKSHACFIFSYVYAHSIFWANGANICQSELLQLGNESWFLESGISSHHLICIRALYTYISCYKNLPPLDDFDLWTDNGFWFHHANQHISIDDVHLNLLSEGIDYALSFLEQKRGEYHTLIWTVESFLYFSFSLANKLNPKSQQVSLELLKGYAFKTSLFKIQYMTQIKEMDAQLFTRLAMDKNYYLSGKYVRMSELLQNAQKLTQPNMRNLPTQVLIEDCHRELGSNSQLESFLNDVNQRIEESRLHKSTSFPDDLEKTNESAILWILKILSKLTQNGQDDDSYDVLQQALSSFTGLHVQQFIWIEYIKTKRLVGKCDGQDIIEAVTRFARPLPGFQVDLKHPWSGRLAPFLCPKFSKVSSFVAAVMDFFDFCDDSADDILAEIIAKDPQNTIAWIRKSRLEEAVGDHGECINTLRRGLLVNSGQVDMWLRAVEYEVYRVGCDGALLLIKFCKKMAPPSVYTRVFEYYSRIKQSACK